MHIAYILPRRRNASFTGAVYGHTGPPLLVDGLAPIEKRVNVFCLRTQQRYAQLDHDG